MQRALVIHPFLFGLFPLISILATNVSEVQLTDALPVVAISLGVVVLVWAIAWIFVRDFLRVGMIASGFIIFLFTPFHVNLALQTWLADIFPTAAQYTVPVVLSVSVSGLLFWMYYFSRKARGLGQVNSIMNVVSISLVGFAGWNIANAKLTEKFDWLGIQSKLQAEALVPNLPATTHLPDIYFIVMDRYAGPQTLKTMYEFDNWDFLEDLEAKGFSIAGRSAANYPSTAQSMASSLNLQYINFLKDLVGPKSDSWIPLNSLVQNHRVRQFLASMDYRYIHLGSWWGPTSKNNFADQNFVFTPFPEMLYILCGTSVLQPIFAALGVLDLRYETWRGNRRQFENLIKTIDTEGPKFVLAHFLLPHDPYVFDRDGGYIPTGRIRQQAEEVSYIDQLVYTNRMLKKTIDLILSKSETPPVILLQADEGPYPRRFLQQDKNFDWGEATDAEIDQKMKILNAFYLPGVDRGDLYPSISPVNTFRLIFNLYFKTNLPMLPDESFVYRKYRHPYDLMNITSRLASD
jgi:hypothetical protein